ncbi:ABC transporter permease [Pseudoclavibacter chungangensis]|uniref:ABC transporter permease n=1 Tax=Pseudoclavibacter chungangensis TaxID=587635 RepID=A0A7J5C1H0_9MICO|nr:ABC transporter permease [Pseudoclavibacter chungangensis]KAB1662487.1 ABC transporter permease [Pseudoclavibacter chungangensis]NYJ68522.1 ribose transport system permease protein [Pseudoclavibacter chungangensis]
MSRSTPGPYGPKSGPGTGDDRDAGRATPDETGPAVAASAPAEHATVDDAPTLGKRAAGATDAAPAPALGKHAAADAVVPETPPAADESARVERAGAAAVRERRGFLRGSSARNLGLVIALVVLVIAGTVTAGERFASIDNLMVVLSLASVIGVLSIGMTFVITAGGIDLSVGSVLGLASVWATTLSTQAYAEAFGWGVIVLTALLVGLGAGLLNGILIAYGRVVAFIATLAMMVAARGFAELIAQRRTHVVDVDSFLDTFRGNLLGVPVIVWIFAAVAVGGWFLLNRTTFGRRTVAVGGNPEAARLAGIKVKRHTMYIYALCGLTAGIGAVMMLARTTAGSSTNGMLYELDAIAAVVVGGTLLVGGRGTIVGTVLGVLIFATLTNVFIQNNLDSSVQAIAKGAIIIVAVLLQQRFSRKNATS